jgi:hypothetical protein
MRDFLRDVLLLQPQWSSTNTPAMQQRGHLVRDDVAGWLRERLPELARNASVEVDDWKVQPSDGAGNKNEIPWVRVHSASRSPSATRGWYVVYLFEAGGDRVYLSLMQGSSRKVNREYKARAGAELRERARAVRDALAPRLRARADLVEKIELNATRSELGPAYEAGTVVAFEYLRDELPSDQVLFDDLSFLMSVLGHLYQLDSPDEVAPEVADAVVVAERSAGRARRGQGLHLTAAQRVAVERRAVAVATCYLVEQGYEVVDVGATESYDLDARRGAERLYVEVKGTTTVWDSSRSEIIVTKNEVDLHLREYPNNMLLVVSQIVLDRSATPPSASGGELRVISPWRIELPNLTPVTYRYLVGE